MGDALVSHSCLHGSRSGGPCEVLLATSGITAWTSRLAEMYLFYLEYEYLSRNCNNGRASQVHYSGYSANSAGVVVDFSSVRVPESY
jgi:hypothetical protein